MTTSADSDSTSRISATIRPSTDSGVGAAVAVTIRFAASSLKGIAGLLARARAAPAARYTRRARVRYRLGSSVRRLSFDGRRTGPRPRAYERDEHDEQHGRRRTHYRHAHMRRQTRARRFTALPP
jgi:hypothetical protein